MKRMSEGGFVTRAMGGVAVVVPGSLDVEKRTCDFVCSTDAPDRYGDVIEQNSWKLDRYLSNPVFLWQHDRDALPIGSALKIGVVSGKLTIKVQFHTEDENPFADRVFKLVAKGALRATSVGFRPGKAIRIDPEGANYGMIFSECELLEVSLVTIPGNADALALSDNDNDARERADASARVGAQKDKPMSTQNAPAQNTPDPNAEMAILARGLVATLGVSPESAIGHVQGLIQKAARVDALETQLKKIEDEQRAARHAGLIERGLSEGKLTPALVESWAKGVDAANLEAFLKVAPVVVPQGSVQEPGAKSAPDSATKTAADAIAAGKKWEDLSFSEKHVLMADHPQIADRMRSEAASRAKAA